MRVIHQAIRGRLPRRWYIPLMAALLGLYGAFVAVAGMRWGLVNAPGLAIPATIAALSLRLILSAARWRDVGTRGWLLSAATTALCIAAPFLLSPSGAMAAVLAILVLEAVLPPRRLSETARSA